MVDTCTFKLSARGSGKMRSCIAITLALIKDYCKSFGVYQCKDCKFRDINGFCHFMSTPPDHWDIDGIVNSYMNTFKEVDKSESTDNRCE